LLYADKRCALASSGGDTTTVTQARAIDRVRTETVTKTVPVVRVKTVRTTRTVQHVMSCGGGSSSGDGGQYAGMNCSGIGHSFQVTPGSDPQHDADNDGIACESCG
jgi:hypothetical protein